MPRLEPPECLRRRFELAHTELVVAGRRYELLRPRSVNELICEEDFALDGRIPYWADCWPSSRVLAERIARERGRGRRLLELGCGIGLVSLVAAQAGFDVLATDYYAAALEFTAANAQRHDLHGVDTRLVDWRSLPDDLETFDVVAASDVLYEAPQAALVAAALASTLAPQGLGLLSDPGRRTAEAFVERCASLGLTARCAHSLPSADVGAGLAVSIFEIRRACIAGQRTPI
ncbi:MAG TPA: class I SAM-dependent methyltransferase [Pirellulales bacterium]|nr:class I SAM-dependent methyltransferase [Pirellulales bacterium]